jgi:hypothetical protein
MRHAALGLLALLAIPLASCDRAPTASAAARRPDAPVRLDGTANASAVGAVRFTFGTNLYDLSFVVSNNGASVTTGYAQFHSHNAGVIGAIDVTCLFVSGNTATFLGEVVESNDAGIIGLEASWQVTDGSPDFASQVNLAEEGPDCTTPGEFDLAAVSAGIIEVN